MASRKIIDRYSSKAMKKSSKPRKRTTKSKKKRKPKKTYTYILHDIELNIYKIGKTQAPTDRFRSLCVRGRIMPIALAPEDIEKELHEKFEANRVEHPEYKYNGSTEWFKRGGKFSSFVDGINKGYYLPYITLHALTEDLIKNGHIIINDPNTQWEMAQSKFAYYFIGREILILLGLIKLEGGQYTTKYPKHTMIIGNKIAISELLLEKISEKHVFYAAVDRTSPIITENADKKKGSRLRKITIEQEAFDSDIYLLMNKK